MHNKPEPRMPFIIAWGIFPDAMNPILRLSSDEDILAAKVGSYTE